MVQTDKHTEEIIFIKDTTTPIAVLIGPEKCGKTMVAYRLFHYLRSHGYTVDIDQSLINTAIYAQRTEHLMAEMVSPSTAAPSDDFILYRISDSNGKPIIQLMDSPGRIWYLNENGTMHFHKNVLKIADCPNQKKWVFFTEPDWKTDNEREFYSQIIHFVVKNYSKYKRDRYFILLNKVESDPFFFSNTMPEYTTTQGVNMFEVRKYIQYFYFRPLDYFQNITWLYSRNLCELLPFFTGVYSEQDGRSIYEMGDDWYPERLWRALTQKDKTRSLRRMFKNHVFPVVDVCNFALGE